MLARGGAMNVQSVLRGAVAARDVPRMLTLGASLQGLEPDIQQQQLAKKMGWRKCKGCGEKKPKGQLTQKGKAADYVFCAKCVKKWKVKLSPSPTLPRVAVEGANVKGVKL